jgi:hypothetical protein
MHGGSGGDATFGVFCFSGQSAVADWHGGKALVMYKAWSPDDGWVRLLLHEL